MNKTKQGLIKKINNTVINAQLINLVCLFVYVFGFIFTPAFFLSRWFILYPCMIIWFITSLFIDSKWILKNCSLFLFIIGYFLILVCDDVMIGHLESVTRFANSEIYFLMFLVYGIFYLQNYEEFNFKPFILTCAFLLFISYILTMVGNIKYPNASRDLASFINPMCQHYKNIGIGGLAFVYQSFYLIASLMFIFNNKLKLKYKIIIVCYIMVICFTIYITDYTTAFILAVGTIFLCFIFSNNKNIQLKIVLLFVFTAVAYLLRVQIMEFIVDNIITKESVIRQRLMELLVSFKNSDASLERIELMKESIVAFINNPLTGELGKIKTVGGHSDFIDVFGRFGLIGAFIYHGIFITLFIKQSKFIKSRRVKIYFIIINLLLLLSRFTNPLIGNQVIGFQVFLYSPIIMYGLDIHENKYIIINKEII